MKLRNVPWLAILLFAAGCTATAPWQDSDARFIPVELWAGAAWDGAARVEPAAIDAVSGKRRNRRINGPAIWTHPFTGEDVVVYERVNRKSSGEKRQLFAFNHDRSGLGRVYDVRPGAAERYFDGEVIFPIGYWRRGEERNFPYYEYTDAGAVERVATIKIRRLDYTYNEVPHSLKYDWILRDENGAVLFHENYIYSPGRSLVRFRDRLED